MDPRWLAEVTMPVRVLVVDDQEPFRLAAAAVVAAVDGFELVGSAATGEASLAAVEQLQPDLVLMDINLPGLDGLETTRRIRARRSAVRVLLISSTDGYPDPEECGAMGYLAKRRLGPAQLHRVWAGRQPSPPPPAKGLLPTPTADAEPHLEGVPTMTIHPRTGQADRPGQKEPTPQEGPVEQHSLPQSLALHLLPGIVLAAIFYGAAPWVMRAGFPAIVSGMLGAVVGILGLELGWLLYQARRRTGRFSLSAVLGNRPISPRHRPDRQRHRPGGDRGVLVAVQRHSRAAGGGAVLPGLPVAAAAPLRDLGPAHQY